MATLPPGAEDVSPSDFVKSIRALGDKKDAEDAERLAQLERDIEQGRKEREVRRAERARSISPEKSHSPSLLARSRDPTPLSSPRNSTPTASAKMADDSASSGSISSQPTATQLARSGTLSWQQRPKSRSGEGRRPLSWLAQENSMKSPKGTPEPVKSAQDSPSDGASEPSRAQISQSLGSKDPAWFRQTADRGIGSAAYRRSQEEDTEAGASAGRMRLPGMSRELPPETENASGSPLGRVRSSTPSQTNSIHDSTFSSNRSSNTTTATEAGSMRLKSPPLSILEPPKLEPSSGERKAMAGGRPASPTKGMGGFVESAMLKRADSVSKRWSQTPGTGVARNSSTASNRNSYMGGYGGSATTADRASPSLSSRETSLDPGSRPTSSHSNLTIIQLSEHQSTKRDDDGFVKPSVPDRTHSRSKSVASLRSLSHDQAAEPSPPASPSKRWSPTKSSWLESALTKEEKPKVTSQPPPAQPVWMAEINKAKQQRANSPTKDLASPPSTASKPSLFGRENLRAPAKDTQTSNSAPTVKTPASSQQSLRDELPRDSTSTGGTLESSNIDRDKISTIPNESVKAKSPSPEVAPKPRFESTTKAASPIQSPTEPLRKYSSAPAKPAAPAPGKFDFRANLKTRAPTSDANKGNEPEFKNALGNLKRAKTQNYVAPDTLKDNILRGKSGLTITGGVPPRKRVDELKESLVAQKAAIKARVESGEAPIRPQKPAELPETPEALARRQMLSKSESSKEAPSNSGSSQTSTPEALAARNSLKGKTKPVPPEPTNSSSRITVDKNISTIAEKSSSQKKADPVVSSAKQATSALPATVKQTNAPVLDLGTRQTEAPGLMKSAASSKLANRFNPALASILARGPPGAGSSTASPGESSSTSQRVEKEEKTGSSSEALEHKTKGRARGPKRRAPTKQVSAQVSSETAPAVAEIRPVEQDKDDLVAEPKKPAVSTPSKHARIPSGQLVRDEHVLRSSPTAASGVRRASPLILKPKPSLPLVSHKPVDVKSTEQPTREDTTKPISTTKTDVAVLKNGEATDSPSVAKTRPLQALTASRSEEPPKTGTPSKATIGSLFEQRFQQTPPSRNSNASPITAEDDSLAPRSVRNSAALFAKQDSPGPFSPGKRSPVRLPTRHDEERAMRDAGLMPPPEQPLRATKQHLANSVGLGIAAAPVMPSDNLPLSPPASGDKLNSSNNGAVKLKTPSQSPRLPAPAESPIPHTSEATRLFTDFFDDRPVMTRTEDIDTLSILESAPWSTEKVTTLRKQMQEITSDGKLSEVPSHQEHILYDQSMYVCTHSFSNSRGTRTTETYLWAGSDVSPASLEDAQLFAKRVARDQAGKFILIQQGQETPAFLQALGGILIVFRGSRSRNSIGVPPQFILCGRRHLGHVVFDEVDFSLHSFCSGFPYLISKDNRLYLWKGVGCHQEELSSARLITMDVSPMPDLSEIEEGKEPASFFGLFPALPKYPKNSIPRSADHWRLRPKHENYRTRLFKIEQVQPQKSMSLQVSSFFSSVIKRRPSWSSFGNASPSNPSTPVSELPITPKTAKSSTTNLNEPSPTTFEQPRAINAEPAPIRIAEIAPFGQADLKAEGVWVLDAFFEVYVIIGPLANAQSHAFAAALQFAQDYGILAASMEDRPFVPVSTVVMEGAPRDMKFCFRQWDNERGVGGTEALMAGSRGIRRAGSLRCVGLSAALASLRAGT